MTCRDHKKDGAGLQAVWEGVDANRVSRGMGNMRNVSYKEKDHDK